MAYRDIPEHWEMDYYRPRRPPPIYLSERDEVVNYFSPRRQLGDFYCVVCNAQMDTEIMFGNHMRGSRHAYNSSKFEFSGEEPIIQKVLDRETTSIVGLDHIWEISLLNDITYYQCFLCSAGLKGSTMFMEHILGLNHQMAFLKEHVEEKYSLVRSLVLAKSDLEPIVNYLIYKYETKHGRGQITVRKEKNIYGSPFSFVNKSYNEGYAKRPHPNNASNAPSPKYFRTLPQKFDKAKEWPSSSLWKISTRDEKLGARIYPDKPSYSNQRKLKQIETESMMNKMSDAENQKQDSKVKQGNSLNSVLPTVSEGNKCSDIEVIFEKTKKNGKINAEKTNMVGSSSAPRLSKESSSVSEKLLKLVDNISLEEFLWLTLLKLDKFESTEDIELKLLERVIVKATAISQNTKKEFLDPNMKAINAEILNKRSASPQDGITEETSKKKMKLEDFSGKNDMINKSAILKDVCIKESKLSCLKSSEQCNIKQESNHQLNNASSNQNSVEGAATIDLEVNLKLSNTLPYQMFASIPTCIPGLTLTEDSA